MAAWSKNSCLLAGFFLYQRSGIFEELSEDSCILSNNTAAIGEDAVNTGYGTACHSPSPDHTVTWYYPNGEAIPRLGSTIIYAEPVHVLDTDWEIRRGSNFRPLFDGIYACVSTDPDGSKESLFLGLYTSSSSLSDVRMDAAIDDLAGIGNEEVQLILSCSSSGSPVSSVAWYYREQHIVVGEQVQLIPNRTLSRYDSMLVIGREELSGMLERGEYMCQVSSGATSLNASLTFAISKLS